MAVYDKPDFWSQRARKEGYPARSVYKLKEIDEKFALFDCYAKGPRRRPRVLDLGAAPGSWSLYVLRLGRDGLFLAAADLEPLSRRCDGGLFDRENFFFVQGDFTRAEVRAELERRGPYTALVSDAAPATTGSRTVDTLRSLALAEEVLLYAERCLAPGGNLALKVFQGGDQAALLGTLRERFNSVKSFKPAACRKDSFETYYIGLGKKGTLNP
jgi:23S rRNA (uridine2552-2'-O)-methyltransferase